MRQTASVATDTDKNPSLRPKSTLHFRKQLTDKIKKFCARQAKQDDDFDAEFDENKHHQDLKAPFNHKKAM